MKTAHIVGMMGARMNYAVPMILHSQGMLAILCTDYAIPNWLERGLSIFPDVVIPDDIRRLQSRKAHGIPEGLVKSFNSFGIEYWFRLRKSLSEKERIAVFLWAGRTFCKLLNKNMPESANSIYVYNTAGLETLEYARARGMKTVLEQSSAPRETEEAIMEKEYSLFRDWEDSSACHSPEYAKRQHDEWQLADTIICGSEFVRECVIENGGPGSKCKVVPYGIEIPEKTTPKDRKHGGPIRVLFAGRISLQKGVQYLLKCANKLRGTASVRCVGTPMINPSVLASYAQFVEFTGAVPRQDMASHYQWADVFVLPSLCEGSAIVTYEALAHGVPVICTPNSGSTVRDGYNGFIVPLRDADAISAKLLELSRNDNLLGYLSSNALLSAHELSIEAYGKRLLNTINTP